MSIGLVGKPSIWALLPAFGRAGTVVLIAGENLKGTTSVTFGGVEAAKFTVISSTEIRATVPVGAKTGQIGVTTPGGTALSRSIFRMM